MGLDPVAVRAAATCPAEDSSPELMVAINDHCFTTFPIDTGTQIWMVDKVTYQGQPPLGKQLVSIVGVHGQVTTHPLPRAELILSNGTAVHPTLLLGPDDRCLLGMDLLKGRLWVDPWGKS